MTKLKPIHLLANRYAMRKITFCTVEQFMGIHRKMVYSDSREEQVRLKTMASGMYRLWKQMADYYGVEESLHRQMIKLNTSIGIEIQFEACLNRKMQSQILLGETALVLEKLDEAWLRSERYETSKRDRVLRRSKSLARTPVAAQMEVTHTLTKSVAVPTPPQPAQVTNPTPIPLPIRPKKSDTRWLRLSEDDAAIAVNEIVASVSIPDDVMEGFTEDEARTSDLLFSLASTSPKLIATFATEAGCSTADLLKYFDRKKRLSIKHVSILSKSAGAWNSVSDDGVSDLYPLGNYLYFGRHLHHFIRAYDFHTGSGDIVGCFEVVPEAKSQSALRYLISVDSFKSQIGVFVFFADSEIAKQISSSTFTQFKGQFKSQELFDHTAHLWTKVSKAGADNNLLVREFAQQNDKLIDLLLSF